MSRPGFLDHVKKRRCGPARWRRRVFGGGVVFSIVPQNLRKNLKAAYGIIRELAST
jgi:hypothetical protein